MFNFVKNGQFDNHQLNLTNCHTKRQISLQRDFRKPSENRTK